MPGPASVHLGQPVDRAWVLTQEPMGTAAGEHPADDLALMCDAVQSAETAVPALVDTSAVIEVGWSVDIHAM